MAREDDANNPDRLSNGSQFYIVWGKKYRPRTGLCLGGITRWPIW